MLKQKIIAISSVLLFLAGLQAVTTCFATELSDLAQEPSLEQMAGQMLLIGFPGQAIKDNSPIAQALRSGQVGGVVLFSRNPSIGARNIVSPTQLRTLTSQLRALAPDLLIAVDQEGGQVQRLGPSNGFSDWPSAKQMGLGSPAQTLAIASAMGAELAAYGININLAPVVDLHFDGSKAIGRLGRAFSDDPAAVAAHARAFVQGMEANGICTALKHFPGHGSTLDDTHDGFADATPHWTEAELEPYRLLLAQGYQGIIMPAHITLTQYGNLPADLNPNLINGLLRNELGWQGVVATDDLHMGAIRNNYTLEQTILKAVEAGADLLLFCNNPLRDERIGQAAHATLLDLVAQGKISPERIQASWQRIQNLKQSFIYAAPAAF